MFSLAKIFVFVNTKKTAVNTHCLFPLSGNIVISSYYNMWWLFAWIVNYRYCCYTFQSPVWVHSAQSFYLWLCVNSHAFVLLTLSLVLDVNC